MASQTFLVVHERDIRITCAWKRDAVWRQTVAMETLELLCTGLRLQVGCNLQASGRVYLLANWVHASLIGFNRRVPYDLGAYSLGYGS